MCISCLQKKRMVKNVSLKTYRKFNPQNFLQTYCQKYDSNPSTNHTPQFFGNFVTYSHWLGRPAPPSRADKNNGGGTKAEKDQRKVFHLVEQFPSHVRWKRNRFPFFASEWFLGECFMCRPVNVKALSFFKTSNRQKYLSDVLIKMKMSKLSEVFLKCIKYVQKWTTYAWFEVIFISKRFPIQPNTVPLKTFGVTFVSDDITFDSVDKERSQVLLCGFCP